MGYWYIDGYDEENQEDFSFRIGHKDVPKHLRVYAGDYEFDWNKVENTQKRKKQVLEMYGQLLSAENITDASVALVTASRLARKRKALGLTKKDMAQRLGITPAAYNAYELAYVKTRDRSDYTIESLYSILSQKLPYRIPSVPKLIQLAKMLDCSVEYLIGVSDDDFAKFEDYKSEHCTIASAADRKKNHDAKFFAEQNPIAKAFANNFDQLTATQQGILYGKLCEMLAENGVEI